MFRYITILSLAVWGFCAPIMAQNVKKEELPALIAEYLKKNPEIIIEALQEYEAKNQKNSIDAMAGLVKKIIADKSQPAINGKDADIIIVEFYDYNCGYCKKIYPELMKLVKEDGKIKWILVDFPILAPSSFNAALGSLIAHKNGKFEEYHGALQKSREISETSVQEILTDELKIDKKELINDKLLTQYRAMLKNNLDMGRKMGINGTPALIITNSQGVMPTKDKSFIPGFVEYEKLKAIIAENRKAKNGG